MVTDHQVRRLFKLMQTEPSLAIAAAKAGMDEKTARKYRRLGKLPSQIQKAHTWRTRPDPFAEVWDELKALLEINPGLMVKTLFDYLNRRYPGRFQPNQIRTLYRRIRQWRALEGPAKEVFFAQDYVPGERCQSDFTYMNDLRVTIQGQPFDHLIYHFVLPYSNWETGTICFSESFESLSMGLQNALFELGGVPQIHQTDSMSAAVRLTKHPEVFTERYQALLNHYGLRAQHTQVGAPHENGDVEQAHYRFKTALDQSLMLRGSRDFETQTDYGLFLDQLLLQLNLSRRARLIEELERLHRLPKRRLDAFTRLTVKVGPGSTIRIHNNYYSVPSRLIGERVRVHLYAERVELWYAGRHLETMPRLRGSGKHRINYRHVIDWLVRKPGAFARYRYRSDLFPTHRFRLVYDLLLQQHRDERRAAKIYLRILHLAARQSESAVDAALRLLIDQSVPLAYEAVAQIAAAKPALPTHDVEVAPVDLGHYDGLLRHSL